jgi:hypothetical protein
MRVRASTILRDAWAAWRADWAVLTSIAGTFLFLPQLAVLLLVPPFPDLSKVTSTDPDDPALRAAAAKIAEWLVTYAPWQVGAMLLATFGQFAMIAWYLLPDQPSVGRALAAALRLLPRMVLASLAWSLPLGLLAIVLLQMALPFLIFPIFALVLARTLLVGPALVAERPIGAFAAIGRSFRATQGQMMMLASVILGVVIAQYLLAMPLVAADQWMEVHAPNPIARAIVDAGTAIVAMVGGVAMALIQVAAWRKLR